MATSRDRIRDLMRRAGRRSVKASKAADVVSDQFQDMARVLLSTDSRFADAVTAMREVLGFMDIVKGELSAAAGHAVEGAHLATDHAHELRQIATIAGNLPELEQADAAPIARYTLPENYTPEMARRVAENLAADVLREAGDKYGITFELVARRDDD